MAQGSADDVKNDITIVNEWRDGTYTILSPNTSGSHTYLSSSVAEAIPSGYHLIGVTFANMPDWDMLPMGCYVTNSGDIYTTGYNRSANSRQWKPYMCLWCVK